MRSLYFFIGTEAEIMKMFMVINKAKEAGFDCRIISSGQNDITYSPFLSLCHEQIAVDLSIYKPSGKNGLNYLKWFLRTLYFGIKKMRSLLSDFSTEQLPIMVVHGDTMSTLLGTIIAKAVGMPCVHVEGGLRSGHWFNPFPEEIDRFFSSKYADIIFCPGAESAATAERSFLGEAVDTVYNTNIETLEYAYDINRQNPIKRVYEGKYFVVALHRQENLLNRRFMEQAIESVIQLSQKIHGVFIYHQQTMDILKKYELLDKLTSCSSITVVPRMPYIAFIDAVDKAEFLVADGAGNQQEMYYMGKPYLIMRKHIEKEGEGQNHNCIGFENDFDRVVNFDKEYLNFKQEKIVLDTYPSKIIVDKLLERYES